MQDESVHSYVFKYGILYVEFMGVEKYRIHICNRSNP
jgi:hypothetical protein